MSATWNTKYGTRRVRYDPPTLAEAIAAAQGFTDDAEGQISFAAELMGVSPAEVKAEMQRLAPDRRTTRLVATNSKDNGIRTVVVERKTSRRVGARADMAEFARSDVPRVIPKISLQRTSTGR